MSPAAEAAGDGQVRGELNIDACEVRTGLGNEWGPGSVGAGERTIVIAGAGSRAWSTEAPGCSFDEGAVEAASVDSRAGAMESLG